MKYDDGSEARIGDRVWWDEGDCVGYVRTIITDRDELAAWGMADPTMLISTTSDPSRGPFVGHPECCLVDEGIGPPSATENAEIDALLAVAERRLETTRSWIGLWRRHAMGVRIGWFAIWYPRAHEHRAFAFTATLDDLVPLHASDMNGLFVPIGGGGPA